MPSRRAAPPETKRTTAGWLELWFRGKSLKHVVFKMHGGAFRCPKPALPLPPLPDCGQDLTRLVTDETLLLILSRIPPPLRELCGLVCRRWLRLVGRLRHSLTLLDWSFLGEPSCRLLRRFPELIAVDLVPASIIPPVIPSGILLTRGSVSVGLDPEFEMPSASPWCSFIPERRFLPSEVVDRGLEILAQGFPALRKLSLVAVASDFGLLKVADECPTLQEMDLHRCTDASLRPISAFRNLQILKLIGSMEGLYEGPGVSDIGLTILAHGCKRLVKLELSGCEGSYDGICAIGRCCPMLEELTICDHRMDAGWMAGLSFCENLKTLRLHGCRRIDPDPGPEEHLGWCPAMEGLHLRRCQLRDKTSARALFMVCAAMKEMVFQDCWGLDDELFSAAAICREVKALTVEGCSTLTANGLESAVASWKELERLRVVSCNGMKDSDVSPALAGFFSLLKELKWRPDSRSLLATSVAGTGIGNKGGRFFK